ncbi:MAG: adenylate/guanylate cyclase domain-containing protein [Candidatus Marinimicrobia bacterium]|nr:adenylate/guanylate cyclase domain-containing protein [Candidatus Neomarinimicrobiota bacterium]
MPKLPDRVKQALIGSGLGLFSALFIWTITVSEWSFLKRVVDGYEFRSYDARFRARTADFQEESIDTVLIIDIDQQSINELGNYFRWFHDQHGELIDYIRSGQPKAILFDILFDPEPDLAHDTAFVRATYRAGNVYHAIALSLADSLNFQYPMTEAPQGVHRHVVGRGESLEQMAQTYFGDPAAANFLRDLNADLLPGGSQPVPGQVLRIPMGLDAVAKTLEVPSDMAARLPSGERFDNTFIGLLNASRGIGSANFPQDSDGVIRRSPTAVYFSSAGEVYPSLTMAAAMDILDVPRDGLTYDLGRRRLRMTNRAGEVVRNIPIDDQGRLWVNYYGTFRTFRYIPYAWVTPDMLPAAYFEDKIVLVGSTLPGLMDLRSTPVQESFPGVEIHANVIWSLLQDEFVRPISRGTMLWIVMALGLVLGGLFIGLKAWVSLLVALAAAIGWTVFAYARFLGHLEVFEVVRPLFSMGGTFISVNLYQYLVLEKDKRFLRKTFSTYISPELIDDMVAAKCEPQLGGESGLWTAYFTDIQSFSSFSEILSATRLVELLNEYLTGMTDILLDNGGTLDKYEGDAIVAFFGAPLYTEDHATRALNTALGMQLKLADLRAKWQSEGDKWPEQVHQMRMRIGINSGEFVTGNMGSRTRMNYTMMGDVVNTAARLEASAKQYGIYIQCTIEALQLAGPEAFEWREIDKVRVVGKSKAVETVEIMGYGGELPAEQDEMRAIFQAGLRLYRQQSWDEAKGKFKASQQLEAVFPNRPTTPSRVYTERCDFFQANPPGKDWDGSWTLTAK